MQAVIEAKRLHCNRRGRWSEQQKTPALASRGEKNHIETERRNGHAVYRMGWRA